MGNAWASNFSTFWITTKVGFGRRAAASRKKTPPLRPRIEAVRKVLATACGTTDTGPVFNATCTANICGGLLEACRVAAGDPDAEIAKWLADGAPAGIRVHAKPCGIFPKAASDVEIDAESRTTAFDEFENYAGVEADDAAITEILSHLAAGHLRSYGSIEELANALGEDPILSKIRIITRTRAGRTKKRVILDTRESLLRWASEKGQRILLPRLLDAVMQILEHIAPPSSDEYFGISEFVLDFAEAFWQVPLHPSERKLFLREADYRWG